LVMERSTVQSCLAAPVSLVTSISCGNHRKWNPEFSPYYNHITISGFTSRVYRDPMPVSKVINQQSFHDGKVVLYQLENRPKRLWLCRMKVPHGAGYIYRGTGTSDLYEARKLADELFDELRINVKLGKSITGPNLKRLVDEFEEHSKVRGKQSNRDVSIIALLKLYAVPYFANRKITEINQQEIARFFDWRRQNSAK
jgi:hypothetical protein